MHQSIKIRPIGRISGSHGVLQALNCGSQHIPGHNTLLFCPTGLPDGTQLEQSLLQALLAASHAPVVQIPTSIHMAKHASRLVHARSRLHKVCVCVPA